MVKIREVTQIMVIIIVEEFTADAEEEAGVEAIWIEEGNQAGEHILKEGEETNQDKTLQVTTVQHIPRAGEREALLTATMLGIKMVGMAMAVLDIVTKEVAVVSGVEGEVDEVTDNIMKVKD